MPYSTLQDLINAVGRDDLIDYTDDEGLKTIIETRVNAAITSADQLIDSFLGGRYVTPLATVPEIVRDLSVDLAVYALAKRRFVKQMPEAMTDRYLQAVKTLEKIERGMIRLPVATPPAEEAEVTVAVRTRTKYFSNDLLSKL